MKTARVLAIGRGIGFARGVERAGAMILSRGAAALAAALLLAGLMPQIAQARDVLGIFSRWGAFRDVPAARCFAIAEPAGQAEPKTAWRPFAAIGWWPKQNVRGQLNLRLSRQLARDAGATLSVGGKRFALGGSMMDVWAKDRRDDAAIIAAMRAGGTMSVYGRAATGSFTDRYDLRGAATAMDAAALGCARMK